MSGLIHPSAKTSHCIIALNTRSPPLPPIPPPSQSLLTSFTQLIYFSIQSADGSARSSGRVANRPLSLECLHVSAAPGGIDFASMTRRVNRLISPAEFRRRCPLLHGLHMRSQTGFSQSISTDASAESCSGFFCGPTG